MFLEREKNKGEYIHEEGQELLAASYAAHLVHVDTHNEESKKRSSNAESRDDCELRFVIDFHRQVNCYDTNLHNHNHLNSRLQARVTFQKRESVSDTQVEKSCWKEENSNHKARHKHQNDSIFHVCAKLEVKVSYHLLHVRAVPEFHYVLEDGHRGVDVVELTLVR